MELGLTPLRGYCRRRPAHPQLALWFYSPSASRLAWIGRTGRYNRPKAAKQRKNKAHGASRGNERVELNSPKGAKEMSHAATNLRVHFISTRAIVPRSLMRRASRLTPLRGCHRYRRPPTACAVGFNLPPLRGCNPATSVPTANSPSIVSACWSAP
jgi:hypothetical protein